MDNTPKPSKPLHITQERIELECEFVDYVLYKGEEKLKTWHTMVASANLKGDIK